MKSLPLLVGALPLLAGSLPLLAMERLPLLAGSLPLLAMERLPLLATEGMPLLAGLLKCKWTLKKRLIRLNCQTYLVLRKLQAGQMNIARMTKMELEVKMSLARRHLSSPPLMRQLL